MPFFENRDLDNIKTLIEKGNPEEISLAARASGGPPEFQKYLGFGILSQAGVAIGLAALAGSRISTLPGGAELASLALTMIMATTVVFAIIGPIGVKFAVEGNRKRIEFVLRNL